MRKIIVLLTIALCVCATNKAMGYDFYTVNSNGDTIYYNIKSSTSPLTAEVTYKALNDNSYKGNIIIPDTVSLDSNSYIVISVGDSAFKDCIDLISITIPNTVKTIGKNAFEKCIGLTSITIPASVTSIRNNAFSKDSNLVTVYFNAENCTYMGDRGRAYRVFLDCPLLSNVIIGDDVQIIPELAFAECNALASVTIGKSITTIHHAAFLNDTNLTTLDFNAANCTYMGKKLDSCVFLNCPLTTVTMGNSVKIIPDYAFARCKKLASINIPDSVMYIGQAAFDSCSSLTAIIIPDSVTMIKDSVFFACTELNSITIRGAITNIGHSAFYNCNKLTEIIISDSVKTIGNYAFYNCRSLDSVIIPDLVTVIGNYVFAGCDALTFVTIPDSVTEIGTYAFYNCNKLAAVTIPNPVKTIGDYAFYNCNSLASLDIPDLVTVIGDYAFTDCKSFSSVRIGNSVTAIGDRAFYGCTGITTITIPNSVKTIGVSAFAFNTNLGSVNYNATNCTFSGKSIAFAAFFNCPSLSTLVIGNNVTAIPDWAFSGCNKLTSIVIPDSVTLIGTYAFRECSALASVTMGNLVSSIGNGAFTGCHRLTSINIPDLVTTIGHSAFADCKDLASVTIGKSVSNIGDEAFSKDTLIATLSVNAVEPPQIYINTFYLVPKNIPVQVICGSEGYYKNDPLWNKFTNIQDTALFQIRLQSNYPYMGTPKLLQAPCQNNTAIIMAMANVGYRFVKWDDGNNENPRTLTVTSDTNFTAEFEIMVYHVTVTVNDATMGTVKGEDNYARNTIATIEAIPNAGYHFVQWSDSNKTNPRTLVVLSDTTFEAVFEATTSIKDIKESSITVYPNPATDNITLILPENINQAFFTLYDMQGRVLIQQTLTRQNTISVTDIAKGIYIYRITAEKQNYQGKLLRK